MGRARAGLLVRALASSILFALAVAPILGYATPFVLTALAFTAGLVFIVERGMPPPGAGLSIGATFAALFLLILAALPTARTPADLLPLFGFSILLFHAPLVAVFVRLSDRPGGDRNRYRPDLGTVLMAGAAVALVTALVYRFGLSEARAGEGATLIDPHRLASFAVTFGMLALMDWRSTGRHRWWLLAGPALAFATVLLTGSRAGLVALPVLLCLAAAMLGRRRWVGVAVAAGLVAAGLVAALLLPLPGTERVTLARTVGELLAGGPASDAAIGVRLKVYALGWEAFYAQPIHGYGWAHLMDTIAPRLVAEQQAYGPIPHLHDDGLNFAVGGGVMGICAWLLILAAPFVAALRLPREDHAGGRTYGLVALGTSAILLGLPDTLLSAPASLSVFLVLCAALSGGATTAPADAAAASTDRDAT